MIWKQRSSAPHLESGVAHIWKIHTGESLSEPHDALRKILSGYLGMDPVEIHLIKGPHGKPMLSEGSVQFNLSHSGSCALVGVSSVPVGIDVEDMSKPRKTEDLRRRFFSDRENAEIDALPVALQEEAFFHCWTRKEAYLKAIGLGIGIPLKSFSVSVAPDGPVELLASEESPEAPRQWWFQRIPLDAPYVGCITLSRESTFKNFKTCFFQYLEG